jgi:hypothetical protein
MLATITNTRKEAPMADERAIAEQGQALIDMLRTQIADVERDTAERKKLVNTMCRAINKPALYRDEELSVQPVVDEEQFYGITLADALVESLRWRRAAGLGAPTVDELMELLKRGGFNSKSTEGNFRRAILATLRKDSQFHKLPRGRYGMAAWYPNATRDAQPVDEFEAAGDETPQAA